MIISRKKWENFKKEHQKEIEELKQEIYSQKIRTNEMLKITTEVLKKID